MHPEDKKIRDAFMAEKRDCLCEICAKRVGVTAHEIFRRRRGLVRFALWVCATCHGKDFWQAHGMNEKHLRWIYCKIMLKKRPELAGPLWKLVPRARHELSVKEERE